nr:carboxypeptidase-like regulatory domain-containing protein [Chitinophagales bacterium]
MRYTLFIISLLTWLSSIAQNGIITGTISDAASNEPIPFATISLQGSTTGTASDIDGHYSLEGLEPGLYNIEIRSVGYRSQTAYEIQVTNVKPVVADFRLETATEVLDAVVIEAGPNDKTAESPVSLRTIGVNEIKRNPGANRDISLVIQSLPGVASTASFRNDILIRGGA